MKHVVLIVSLLVSSVVFAAPARVIISRHAEKPDDSIDGSGPDLSPVGFQRAEALTRLFEIHPEYAQPHLPDDLFAAQYIPGETSNRSIETLTPLAQALRRPLNTAFSSANSFEFGQMLLTTPYNGHVIMIAWKHSEIPNIVFGLGASSCPQKWNSASFDRLWIIDFVDGKAVSCRDVPQSVLPGDSQ